MSSVATGTTMDTAKLSYKDHEIEIPVTVGTEDEHGLDISKLRGQTGMITLDEGYVNTGSVSSNITFLNGEQGILRYRGYPIEEIAKNCDFVETSYLLIHGELPTESQLQEFHAKPTPWRFCRRW